MTNKTAITFTLRQTQLLAEAMVGERLAGDAKAVAFKLIKRKVPTVDDIPRARAAFHDAAMVYAADAYGLSTEVFIHAVINGKDAEKVKGIPVRTMRDLVRKTRDRWMKYYTRFLKEGVVDGRAAGAAKKKRATKGAVVIGKADNKPVDTPELNQAPDTTPIKRAIEFTSSIPRMIMEETLPSQCEEDLRAEIEVVSKYLGELLGRIKS